MKLFNILTTFPSMFDALNYSMIKRASEDGKIKINVVNIRDFSASKNRNTDDYPYGGGKGMIMTCQPIISALDSLNEKGHVIFMSPKGTVLNQQKVQELSKKSSITILCGRYEGIDQRIIDYYVDEEISIGDYVLTGGELPAMVLLDTLTRLEEGVLNEEAYSNESHYNGLLEYCQYTRPDIFEDYAVPEVLLSGNHRLIEEYKKINSLQETFLKRPDLLEKRGLTDEESKILIALFGDKKDDIIKFIK
ncbi:MAG: tRNA (guanosine(37)-N1)-methyltransferase TrmD [Clostridia bacterium]|nr:tRNA (guanosine(37)-N1)-methyltransferase TrmD [Clostridia bacterium]